MGVGTSWCLLLVAGGEYRESATAVVPLVLAGGPCGSEPLRALVTGHAVVLELTPVALVNEAAG